MASEPKKSDTVGKLALIMIPGAFYALGVKALGFWPSTILLLVAAALLGLMLVLAWLFEGEEHDIVVRSSCVSCRDMRRRRVSAFPKLDPTAFHKLKPFRASSRALPSQKEEAPPAAPVTTILVEEARESQAPESRAG